MASPRPSPHALEPRRRARAGWPKLDPAAALLPLRLFLGGTFVYAGIQKLSDPGFLHPGAPTYIGTQLRDFAHGTPGGFLLRAFALPDPKLAGMSVALLEIAVGMLVVAGLLTRLAAAVGLGLNLLLFLTNSWHTSPYFLGSDIVFVFAWLPFVLTGATGQPAIDHALDRWAAHGAPWLRLGGELATRWEADLAGTRATRARRVATSSGRAGAGSRLTRRGVIAQALGLAGLGALTIGGLSALAKGAYRGPSGARLSAGGSSPTKHRASGSGGRGGSGATTAENASVPSGAVPIGSSSQVPTGQSATYADPSDGQPDILIRDGSGRLRAFSAVCTHAGCQVGYEGGQIVCPCHGGAYSAQTGAVVAGPPPQGLAPRKVVERGGKIYAVPS